MFDRENQTIRLKDGRKLGFAQYGEPSGQPVMYFTGGNSSRLEGRWFDQIAHDYNVNLVVPDRPGFGLSDFQPGRKFLDWPADVAQLAEMLQFDKFAVFGLSGGSPHVAALAFQTPEFITRAAIVSGVAPPEMEHRFAGMWLPVRMIFFFAEKMPSLNRIILQQMGAFYADHDQMLKRMQQALPEPDVNLINENPDIMQVFSAAAMESHRQSIDGDAWEWGLYVRPWGFQLEDIPVEIGLWYGIYDRNVPLGMGNYLARKIPRTRLHIVEDGGHFSTINNHIGEIFDYLLGNSNKS